MNNNINSNLEEDLKLYCKNQDSQLFEEKIYSPLKYLCASICQRNKINSNVIEETVNDMVSFIAVELPRIYDETKGGKAKSMAFILGRQWLSRERIRNTRNCRDMRKTIYIEDIANFDHNQNITSVLEVEIDLLQLQKNTLLQNKELFERLDNKLHRKVSLMILKAIEKPELFKESKGTLTGSIAKRCSTTIDKVQDVIRRMRVMVKQLPVVEN